MCKTFFNMLADVTYSVSKNLAHLEQQNLLQFTQFIHSFIHSKCPWLGYLVFAHISAQPVFERDMWHTPGTFGSCPGSSCGSVPSPLWPGPAWTSSPSTCLLFPARRATRTWIFCEILNEKSTFHLQAAIQLQRGPSGDLGFRCSKPKIMFFQGRVEKQKGLLVHLCRQSQK